LNRRSQLNWRAKLVFARGRFCSNEQLSNRVLKNDMFNEIVVKLDNF